MVSPELSSLVLSKPIRYYWLPSVLSLFFFFCTKGCQRIEVEGGGSETFFSFERNVLKLPFQSSVDWKIRNDLNFHSRTISGELWFY